MDLGIFCELMGRTLTFLKGRKSSIILACVSIWIFWLNFHQPEGESQAEKTECSHGLIMSREHYLLRNPKWMFYWHFCHILHQRMKLRTNVNQKIWYNRKHNWKQIFTSSLRPLDNFPYSWLLRQKVNFQDYHAVPVKCRQIWFF